MKAERVWIGDVATLAMGLSIYGAISPVLLQVVSDTLTGTIDAQQPGDNRYSVRVTVEVEPIAEGGHI
jgi:hypothetical protein